MSANRGIVKGGGGRVSSEFSVAPVVLYFWCYNADAENPFTKSGFPKYMKEAWKKDMVGSTPEQGFLAKQQSL